MCKALNCIGWGQSELKTRCVGIKSQASFLVKVKSQGFLIKSEGLYFNLTLLSIGVTPLDILQKCVIFKKWPTKF